MTHGIGASLPRREDFRLLTGRGLFSDDVNAPGQLYGWVVRSQHAHARITSIDVSAAKAAQGVVDVLTGRDYVADRLDPDPWDPSPIARELGNRDGTKIFVTPMWPLVTDRIRRVGEPVAFVVADTLAHARDAAELVMVEVEDLPAVVDVHSAIAPGAPAVWDEVPGNICIDFEKGDRAAVDDAFAAAAHTVELVTQINRVNGIPLEPLAGVATYDATKDRLSLHAGNGNVMLQKRALCAVFGLPPERVRVTARDVGGNYGTRNLMAPEFILAAWAAKRSGRPVKWASTRSETFLSDPAAREVYIRSELAVGEDGRFLAMRTKVLANLGMQTLLFVPFARLTQIATGVYDIPLGHMDAKAVFTNTLPTSVYRGAGRPEACYLIERLVDLAALEGGIDPAELRRRNLIPAAAIPHKNAMGIVYDSGEFEKNMDMALAIADLDGRAARKTAAERRGKLFGVGYGNYIESTTGMPGEWAKIEIRPEGELMVTLGTMASGQGHETSFAQIVVQLLGVGYDEIEVHEGDTDRVKLGQGSHSSRSMRLGGTLLKRSADAIIDRGKEIAAHHLEAAKSDIEFAGGRFTVVGTDRSLTLYDAAALAEKGEVPELLRGPLWAEADTHDIMPTFPCGSHICEVEVDPDTGQVEIVHYAAIDDVGIVINPLLVDGQTHGGIVQGVGQVLMEDCTYDASGQYLAGSFMDYALPRADDVPSFRVGNNELHSPGNPLGFKGAGEGGTTGALPAVANAVMNALKPLGIRHIDMPLTPNRVWAAIRDAKKNAV